MHAFRVQHNVARVVGGRRCKSSFHRVQSYTELWLVFQTSASRSKVTKFTMPAMSPTMTEGGISSWKKKEGESFTAGDVILEIVSD